MQSRPSEPERDFANQAFAVPASFRSTGLTVEHDSPSGRTSATSTSASTRAISQCGNAVARRSPARSDGAAPAIQIYKYDLNGDRVEQDGGAARRG